MKEQSHIWLQHNEDTSETGNERVGRGFPSYVGISEINEQDQEMNQEPEEQRPHQQTHRNQGGGSVPAYFPGNRGLGQTNVFQCENCTGIWFYPGIVNNYKANKLFQWWNKDPENLFYKCFWCQGQTYTSTQSPKQKERRGNHQTRGGEMWIYAEAPPCVQIPSFRMVPGAAGAILGGTP